MRLASALFVTFLMACSRDAPRETRGADDAGAAADSLDASHEALRPSERASDAGPDSGAPSAEFRGVVMGVVKLAEGASLPTAQPPTMNGQPPTSAKPCPTPDASDQRTVARAAETGGLSPIHVAVTQMKAVPTRAPRVHELFMDACRLRPTMVGALRGDTVRVTNRSEMALLPVLPGDSYMRGILRGETREFTLDKLGTIRVRCEFGSYCGESLVIALSHPLYAVTDEAGRFHIEQVPLDEELMLHAWHPLFKVASVPFKLTSASPTRVVDLAVQPGARAVQPPKPTPTTPPKAARGKRAPAPPM